MIDFIKKNFFWLLIISIILFGEGYYFSFLKSKNSSVPVPKTPTIQDYVRIVSTLSKLQMPPSKSFPIKASALPASLSGIIPQGGAEVFALDYANGKKGFEISFETTSTIRETYNNLNKSLSANGWNFVSGDITNKAALIEKENNAYQLQVMLQTDQTGVKVTIQAIGK